MELAPRYPENRLNLLEAYLQWSDRNSAQHELAALEQLWPGAHTNFTGMAWAASWAQWEPLFARLKAKLPPSAKALGAPHEKQ